MHRRSFLKFLGLSGAAVAVPKGAEFFHPPKKEEESSLPKNMKIDNYRNVAGASICSFVSYRSAGLT